MGIDSTPYYIDIAKENAAKERLTPKFETDDMLTRSEPDKYIRQPYLLTEGIKAKNRTEFETQMILNHKDAIVFIVENPELFASSITFRTVEELHRIIGRNLGIESGIRKKIVRISASNYEPLSGPRQLREAADTVLSVISRVTNPFARGLLALALIPYLQIFEDGNKRTGRMLANALLITSTGQGFSLRKTDARELALAYLAFYEFNSVKKLSKILDNELVRQ